MMTNCKKCGVIMYVIYNGKKTRTLCAKCEEKDRMERARRAANGFASGEQPPV